MERTPEQLWKDAVRGSGEAWNRLYSLFGLKLYQFFLKNTSDPELARDKSQEVFERLFRHREAFSEGSLKTWMFRIARNLLIDHWRVKGRKFDLFGDNPPPIPDQSVNVEESVIAKIHREDMVRLIDATLPLLSDEDRLLIGLVYLGGLSIPELSQVLEIPLGTAKTRVRAARLRLDKLLVERMQISSKEGQA
jgi:RNA polymerase sigma-70 factor (ECF subfamily)